MSLSSRPFVTLPEVVLLEILGYVLVDTPCTHDRAAVLGTCSTFHQLGLSLLYRVVDLRGHPTVEANLRAWETLFGPAGVLTANGRVKGLHERVRELRIGGVQAQDRSVELLALPVVHLNVEVALWEDPVSDPVVYKLLQTVTPLADEPWIGLRTIRMRGDALLCYRPGVQPRRLAFSNWGFKTLHIDVLQSVSDASCLYRAFLDPDERVESDHWWRGMDRIELQVSSSLETEFRRRLSDSKKAGPLARLQRRILPMVVFVDEDSTERKLTEDEHIA